jgi:putative acetyltransferase
MYAAPNGGIILRKEENIFTACVGVRKITDEIGELKRMWVQLPYQKNGIGNDLLQQALTLAKQCNYSLIRLDTLRSMTAAIKLYTKNGFYEIAPYYFNPEKEVVYFEKKLL